MGVDTFLIKNEHGGVFHRHKTRVDTARGWSAQCIFSFVRSLDFVCLVWHEGNKLYP